MSNRVGNVGQKPRVSHEAAEHEIPAVARPKRRDIDTIAAQAENKLLRTIRERKSVRGSGQEWAGEGNVEVNERRAALSVLMSHLTPRALEAALPRRGGKLLSVIAEDLAWLRVAERQPLSVTAPFDFHWAKNASSNEEVLQQAAKRRARTAATAAAALKADPLRAYDASNDSLLVHMELDDAAQRAQVLADTVLQFRAQRRAADLMDTASESVSLQRGRDNTSGRIATSGPISALEQRLACRELQVDDSADGAREYALLRLAVINHPHGSTNSIFLARNAVALLQRFLGSKLRTEPVGEGPGLDISLYNAIHKNYSAQTPKVVAHYMSHKVFVGAPAEARIDVLAKLVEAAGCEQLEAGKRCVADVAAGYGVVVSGADAAKSAQALRAAVLRFLSQNTQVSALRRLPQDDKLFAYQTLLAIYGAVCQERPTAATLERQLFYAGDAWREVASLIWAMRNADLPTQIERVGEARVALRRAFAKATSGFDRQMLWRLDRQVESVSALLLGEEVSAAEKAAQVTPCDDAALGGVLLAVQSALRGVLASGLHAVRQRPKTAATIELSVLQKRIDAMVAGGKVNVEEARALLCDVYQAASEVAESMRVFFKKREEAVHFSGIDVSLAPQFTENLVKETALHYLIGLTQTGMSWGLSAEVSSERLRFVAGARVLNSVGPTVYKRVLIADDFDELARFGPTSDDLCVVKHLDEKHVTVVGGLVADSKDAPGGYAHLSVLAIGHGMSAVALPELSKSYVAFFKRLQRSGAVYVDDRHDSFTMMPLDSAVSAGLLKAEATERLRPGFNLKIRYQHVEGGVAKVIEQHTREVSAARPTREVDLYTPALAAVPALGGAPSLATLGALPIEEIRPVAGEKGAMLAALQKSKALAASRARVPGGAVLPPYRIAELLKAARVDGRSVWDSMMSIWQADPKVGEVTAENFLTSAFYGDQAYRQRCCAKMRQLLQDGLGALLLSGRKPSRQGVALLAELGSDAELFGHEPWIARSSYTAEDRPNKSGAGQYESYAGLTTDYQRLRGIIGVITSGWGDVPVESNVQLEINLQHVWPAVVVQRCLVPAVSGVAVSRGKLGELGTVGYQAVSGQGGGVAGGSAEEGSIGETGAHVDRLFANKRKSLLTAEQQAQLRRAVLAIEAEFHQRLEKGQAYAVDVEWAIESGQLYILQARVIVGV